MSYTFIDLFAGIGGIRIAFERNGMVEAYIYKSMAAKMNDLGYIHTYIVDSGIENFDLLKLLAMFTNAPGLRRSMDKIYEIVAYALFDTIIHTLEVRLSLSVDTVDAALRSDFSDFS